MRRRNARNSLLGSVLLMLLSCAMLLGTTFAWFSDTTTSGAATIQAGNLKVGLEYAKQPTAGETLTWQSLSGTTQANLFSGNELFEPGYTGIVYFRVINEGSLALKYTYDISVTENKLGVPQNSTGTNSEIDLTKYINLWVAEDANRTEAYPVSEIGTGSWEKSTLLPSANGIGAQGSGAAESVYNRSVDSETLKNGQTGNVIAIAVRMPSNTSNEANHNGNAPSFKLSFNVTATQASDESDGFNDQYDNTVPFPDNLTPTTEPTSSGSKGSGGTSGT